MSKYCQGKVLHIYAECFSCTADLLCQFKAGKTVDKNSRNEGEKSEAKEREAGKMQEGYNIKIINRERGGENDIISSNNRPRR